MKTIAKTFLVLFLSICLVSSATTYSVGATELETPEPTPLEPESYDVPMTGGSAWHTAYTGDGSAVTVHILNWSGVPISIWMLDYNGGNAWGPKMNYQPGYVAYDYYVGPDVWKVKIQGFGGATVTVYH